MNFISDAERTIQQLDAYYQQSVTAQKPVVVQKPMAQLAADLELADLVRAGGLSGAKLARFVQDYLDNTTRLHHPGYLAHQCAAPHYASALASLIDGLLNNPMAIYEMGPAAASIEYFVINWMLEKAGWQPGPIPPEKPTGNRIYGGGVLTHGGSLANLTALIAARTQLAPHVWQEGNPGGLALLASPHNHYSIARAAGILGIGGKAIYDLEVDDRGVVIPDRLPAALQRLKNDGKLAVALVANACSTAVGLYDPLREIAAFCRENQVWFHVDGAHGASALLSNRYRHTLDGLELADSLTWDAHKMMRTASLCTAVLVRDARTLDGAFQQEASYLFHDKVEPGFDFIHRTVECTKASLGLRVFMVMAAMGESGLAGYVERQYDLAQEIYSFLQQQPDLECPVRPQANIVCFRVPGSDALQLQIRDRLIEQGGFHLSTSDFNGRRYLRLSLMSPETTLSDIQRLAAQIRKLAAALNA